MYRRHKFAVARGGGGEEKKKKFVFASHPVTDSQKCSISKKVKVYICDILLVIYTPKSPNSVI